jgi:hypothetical protein
MSDPTMGDESPINLPASVKDSQAAQIAMGGSGEEAVVKYWIRQITDALDREKDWRKGAMQCVELYEACKQKDYQYNVLYSNTETFAPALYNQVPRPVVTRRFKDPDPLGKVCSDVVRRMLSFLADANESEYPTFDEMMTQAVLEALVPGRGVVRFKHEVEFVHTTENQHGLQGSGSELSQGGEGNESPGAGGAGASPTGEDSGGEDDEASDAQEVSFETVVAESIPWERFTHGYAKQWRHVPWVAFDHYMTREELCQNFGEGVGARINLTETEKESAEGSPSQDKWSKKRDDQKGIKLALVHEIWDKTKRQVLFVSPGLPKEVIKKCADPLGVTGFFPMPEPLAFFQKIKTLVPTTLYAQYQEQARELNRITIRINRIIGACKVRGFYDKRVSGIDRLMSQDDNTLLPAENIQLFGDGAIDLDKVIWMTPLDKLVSALQILYNQREQIKTVIYDITGVADVMRGASKASETLGAQQIKEQWGSLRISRMQKRVQNFARQCFRIMAEIGVTKLGADTLAKMTGLQYPTGEQKAQAQQMVQLAQKAMQMLQSGVGGVGPPQSPGAAPPPQGQGAPQPLQPGQPPQGGAPPPSQIPPQIQQALQQAQQVASQPSWDDILGVLGDTLSRAYRIDIETNSTIDPEATDDKEQISELLTAISQFVSGIAPLLESGALPMAAVKSMLLAVVRRFRFGPELEDALDQIQQPPPKPDPKMAVEQLKAQVAEGQAQADQAKTAAEAQQNQQKMQLEMQQSQQEHQNKLALAAQEFQLKQQEHQLKLAEMQAKSQLEREKLEMERQKVVLEMQRMQAEVLTARAMPKKPQQNGGGRQPGR